MTKIEVSRALLLVDNNVEPVIEYGSGHLEKLCRMSTSKGKTINCSVCGDGRPAVAVSLRVHHNGQEAADLLCIEHLTSRIISALSIKE